jgi:hypothetical protein
MGFPQLQIILQNMHTKAGLAITSFHQNIQIIVNIEAGEDVAIVIQ